MDWQGLFLGGQGTTPADFQQSSQYQDRDQIQNLIQQGLGRANYQGPTLDQSQSNQFRNLQLAQANQLAKIASGQQQGAGELAAQRQAQNAVAAQQAQARMARGGNAGLALINAGTNTANIGLNAAGQSQQAALQDQANAQNALSQSLNAARGADINIAGQNANNALQAYGMGNSMYGNMLGQLGQMDANQLQSATQAYAAAQGNKGILGGLMNAGGQIGAAAAMGPVASDRKLKRGISSGSSALDEMLDQLKPYAYSYRDEAKHGAGERVGIMAQDLAKSRAGSKVLVEMPDGLGLDPGKAISASLAATARLNERMRVLEKRAEADADEAHQEPFDMGKALRKVDDDERAETGELSPTKRAPRPRFDGRDGDDGVKRPRLVTSSTSPRLEEWTPARPRFDRDESDDSPRRTVPVDSRTGRWSNARYRDRFRRERRKELGTGNEAEDD